MASALWGPAPSLPLASQTLQPASDTGETFPAFLGTGTGYFESSRQAPRRFPPAEGADPACRRVGVCMSVDPERHTLTHTHSHARTHAGPSAAPPAPPRTFTPSPVLPGPVPSPCQRLLTNAASRNEGPGPGETAGSPHHPAVPARPGKGTGKGCPGSLPLGRPSARGRAWWVPPRHVGRAWRGTLGPAAPPRGPPKAGPRPACAGPQPPSAAGAPSHSLAWLGASLLRFSPSPGCFSSSSVPARRA